MIFSYLLNMQSHPSWVCGLKQSANMAFIENVKSHPSWVCGLKPMFLFVMATVFGHTLRGCVD